jgi:hypothetical protein
MLGSTTPATAGTSWSVVITERPTPPPATPTQAADPAATPPGTERQPSRTAVPIVLALLVPAGVAALWAVWRALRR